ncbi:MAG: aminotransferase class V-fold PLP-dependent enzyme [Candidatus Latescibacteria bacterium]|nr:aminotransferase class V-fold PLP-dependent enzyme [Candidatus Latescibacterota bacterium]
MRTRIAATPPDLDPALSAFLAAFPSYAATRRLDELRATEYGRLDRHGHVYLDYTGGGLYADSQLRRHFALVVAGVFGNPHSENLASRASTDGVERARAAVLRFFNASPDEYIAVFTLNASGALKLAGEAYPFGAGRGYLLTVDNHNSVNGIREFARAKGASITYAPLAPHDLRIDRSKLSALLSGARKGAASPGAASPGVASPGAASPGLFAYPAQSNFSGVQHPLDLIDEAHASGWHVLLDAAAFAPTNGLDLGRWKPDLAAISFYKMFGYPTGIGCLLMRRAMLSTLKRPWFGGGTVRIASVKGDGHHLAPDARAYEDGTVDYLGVPAVEIGLDHLSSIGIETLHSRVASLTAWALDRLGALRHTNGKPCVRVHGPRRMEGRGAAVAFNLLDRDGAFFDIGRVEEMANCAGISLRTGCFCNPGAGEVAFGLEAAQIAEYIREDSGMDFDELRLEIRRRHGLEVGAIRISFGLASNFADLFRLLRFVGAFRDKTAAEIGMPAAAQPPRPLP